MSPSSTPVPAALDAVMTRLEAACAQLEHRAGLWQAHQAEATQAALARLDTVLGVLEPLLNAETAALREHQS